MDSIQTLSAFFATFAQVCGVLAVWTAAAFVVAARREAAIMSAALAWTAGNAVACERLAVLCAPDVSAHLELDTDSDTPDLTADLESDTVYELRVARDSRPYIVALTPGERAQIVIWFCKGEINAGIDTVNFLNG